MKFLIRVLLIASWLAWGLYASASYDPQGNTTAKGAQGYYFDLGKRLALVSGVASYSYDGLGRRVYAVSIPQATYRTSVYSQGGQLLYTNLQQGTSNTSTRYIYLAGKLIAEDGTAGVVYTHTDALGSPVARSSSTGTLLSNTWYEPYGKTAQGTNPQTIGFTAHVNDADTGLIYMQQRYYEPVSGRFLSTDQVGTNPNTGGSFNRYAYASNNPYKFVDLDGRVGELFWSASDKVTYTVRYTMAGVASPVGAAAINAQIAKDFSGSVSLNGKTIAVTAQAINVDKAGPGVNTINVVNDTAGVTPSGRSNTDAIGGSIVTIGATGAQAANERTVSHELGGHSGGAGDQYKGGIGADGKILGADVAGPANVMKDLSGQPANSQTLREILKAPTNTNTCSNGATAGNGGC